MNDDDWDFDAVCAEQDAFLDELVPDLQFGSGVFDGPPDLDEFDGPPVEPTATTSVDVAVEAPPPTEEGLLALVPECLQTPVEDSTSAPLNPTQLPIQEETPEVRRRSASIL